MRKRVIHQDSQKHLVDSQDWLDLEKLAQVELTSESASHRIESALTQSDGNGWRASQPGEQTIRILFDTPQRISRIHLVFEETERARTQEFLLGCWREGNDAYREILRQQFNFSPPETTKEMEDYTIDLDGVTAFELRITPEINNKDAFASLKKLRLA